MGAGSRRQQANHFGVRVEQVEIRRDELAIEAGHQAVQLQHGRERGACVVLGRRGRQRLQILQALGVPSIGRVRRQVGCVQERPDVVTGEGGQGEAARGQAQRPRAVGGGRVLVALGIADLPQHQGFHGQHVGVGALAELALERLHALDDLACALRRGQQGRAHDQIAQQRGLARHGLVEGALLGHQNLELRGVEAHP